MKIKSPIQYVITAIVTASVIFSFTARQSATPTFYTIDISKTNVPLLTGHLQLGSNKNPNGETLDANSLYFIRNGKPWFPVMGEFHFSRYPRQQWEESILKMKAAGIDVIATYVFWIYHEEEEEKWNWNGNNDLRYFASLCAKNHIYLFARIGPWCHGEVRNGGFPDWLLKKTSTRKNDPAYLNYVRTFFMEIGMQLKGLYFKDGGPVIGTQIENEFRFNTAGGLAHMLALKKLARDAGIDVPYYSATGWPGSNLKQTELIPVWGGYPEAPWDKSTGKLKLSENYLFGKLRIDPAIGSDLLTPQKDTTDYSGYRYPYATAEIGGGNQITYHRRPIIEAKDVTGIAYVKTGSGANLMGYYMFHGGSNAIGKLSTLQESKATSYPNDYGLINYDFYAPIGEWGQLRPSYRAFKILHQFLNDFGDKLAVCNASFPDQLPGGPGDNTVLRWSVRSNKGSGFIFINNYQRQLRMHDLENVQLNLKTGDNEVLQVPGKPVTISKDAQMIWPFNLEMEGAHLNYATAQLLCRLSGKNETAYVFFAPEGIQPEFSFAKNGIKDIVAANEKVESTSTGYHLNITRPGTSCTLQIKLADGKNVKVIILTHEQALNCWKATIWGADRIFISDNDMIFMDDKVRLQHTGNPQLGFAVYPATGNIRFNKKAGAKSNADGIFTWYTVNLPEHRADISVSEYRSFGNKVEPPQNEGFGELKPNVMPPYGPLFNPITDVAYWRFYIPAGAMEGLPDAFLKIDYTGDTFAAYANGRLIADDFYAGLPMMIGLKRFGANVLDREIILQVTPLSDSIRVYFEEGIREPLKGRNVAAVNKVSFIPQYEALVTSAK